jgi:hypothetical protein
LTDKTLECCICGEDIIAEAKAKGNLWEGGHNPDPIKNGRCCDVCNYNKVVPARIHQLLSSERKDIDEMELTSLFKCWEEDAEESFKRFHDVLAVSTESKDTSNEN